MGRSMMQAVKGAALVVICFLMATLVCAAPARHDKLSVNVVPIWGAEGGGGGYDHQYQYSEPQQRAGECAFKPAFYRGFCLFGFQCKTACQFRGCNSGHCRKFACWCIRYDDHGDCPGYCPWDIHKTAPPPS